MNAPLETTELVTGHNPEFSVIWLHGLGAEENHFEPILSTLQIRGDVRFVFPTARVRRISANRELVVRAWYDILALDLVSVEDRAGIRVSEAAINALIAREMARGIAADHIVLAGFSQGGALALHTGLRCPQRLAGILVLSAYLPLREAVATERSTANAGTPIFMAHGRQDPVVPHALADESRRSLEALDYGVDWRSYAMAHAVCGKEIKDISRWLNARLESSQCDEPKTRESLDGVRVG